MTISRNEEWVQMVVVSSRIGPLSAIHGSLSVVDFVRCPFYGIRASLSVVQIRAQSPLPLARCRAAGRRGVLG
jgi:hypothetical protein